MDLVSSIMSVIPYNLLGPGLQVSGLRIPGQVQVAFVLQVRFLVLYLLRYQRIFITLQHITKKEVEKKKNLNGAQEQAEPTSRVASNCEIHTKKSKNTSMQLRNKQNPQVRVASNCEILSGSFLCLFRLATLILRLSAPFSNSCQGNLVTFSKSLFVTFLSVSSTQLQVCQFDERKKFEARLGYNCTLWLCTCAPCIYFLIIGIL